MANSVIDDIVNSIQALEQSQMYTDQYGDDSQRYSNLRGEPQASYNIQDVQRAAQDIVNSGESLTDGNRVYRTTNAGVNEALYGADIGNNISSDTSGFQTPRQYDIGPGHYAKGLIEAVMMSAVGNAGGALLGAIGGAGGAAGSAASAAGQAGGLLGNANTIVNLGRQTYDNVQDDRKDTSITGGLFGSEFGELGDGIRGGLYDLVVEDRPSAYEQPVVQDQGGGGGSQSQASAPPAAPTNVMQGGASGSDDRGEREDQWIFNGTELVNVATDERREIPNPGRLVVGEVYNGDAEPTGDTREDQVGAGLTVDDLRNDTVAQTPQDQAVQDILREGEVRVTYGDPNASTTPDHVQTGWRGGQGSTNGMSPDGDQWRPGEQSTGGSNNSGDSGQGSGSNGVGDGSDGTGSGDGGDGPGGNTGTLGSSSTQQAGTGNNDLYPYSRIAPSQAAQLSGLIDYVAALRGQN